MNPIPNPIRITIAKTLLCICAIAVFGAIWGIASHDTIILILSLVLALLGCLKVIPLIRNVRSGKYQMLECTVITDKKSTVMHRHQLTFTEDGQEERTITINGRITLKPGRRYRVYLAGREEDMALLSIPDYLKPGRTMIGYELLKD